MEKIRWGILSTARIAHQFAEDFAYVENGSLTAVASRSEETAEKFAARHGIATAYSSYELLFEDPDIDAIYVATPHSLHLAELDRRPASWQSRAVRETADDFGRTGRHPDEHRCRNSADISWKGCGPGSCRQYSGPWRWFEAGEIGRLRHIKSDFGYPLLPYSADRREYNADLGGGVVSEMGIYPIAMAYLFTRSDPISIDVVSHNAPNGVEDDVVAILNYEDCTATLSTSFRCKLPNRTYVIGDKGHIVIPDFWCARECHLYRVDEHIDSFVDDRESRGYDYETTAVGSDILQGRRESAVMPLAVSRSVPGTHCGDQGALPNDSEISLRRCVLR